MEVIMFQKIKNDEFYRQIFKLVLPIVLQNLLSVAVSSAIFYISSRHHLTHYRYNDII